MAKANKKTKNRARTERRYQASSAGNWVTFAAGGISAAAMGGGTYAQLLRAADAAPIPAAPWLLAGGALGLAAAIWFGGSASAIRVGDGGIATERGDSLTRMPWYAVTSVALSGDALLAEGKDDKGAAFSLRLSRTKDANAAGRIVAEARMRVPSVVNLGDDTFGYDEQTGDLIQLEPLHLQGKHCSASDTVITFEADARLCPRCERVYHRAHVPEACACGAALNV